MASTGTGFNWIRQIRLTISGLNGSDDKTFEADGSRDKLRISARIQKSFAMGDPTQIVVWNLSPDTRASFQKEKTKIKIDTCWRDGPRGGEWEEVFFGDLMNSETYRSDTDIVTVIYAISGLDGISRATKNQTYKNIDVKSVLDELAQSIANESGGSVNFDRKNCYGIKGRIGEDGWCAVGKSIDSIGRLGRQYGFSWSITDRQFIATKDKEAGGITHVVGDPELISVNMQFYSNLQWETGVTFACQYNAAIRPHDAIRIKSSIPENEKRFGGKRKIIQVSHDIDSHNSHSFITSGTAFIYPQE